MLRKTKDKKKVEGTEKWITVGVGSFMEWQNGELRIKCKSCKKTFMPKHVKYDQAQGGFLVAVGERGLICEECNEFLDAKIEEKKRNRMARVQLLKEIEDMEKAHVSEAEAEEVEMRKKLEDNQKLREEKLGRLKETLKHYPER